MDIQPDGALHLSDPANRLHQSFRHSKFLQDGSLHHGKAGGKGLEEDEIDDEDEDDEYYEEEEEEDEDEEEEVDDEDGEEELAKPHSVDLLKRNQSPYPNADRTKRAPNNLFGASAILSLSQSHPARGLLKTVAQEKQHRDDWNEVATFALLQVWGAKYLELGLRSLKLEDWTEVADQVTRLSKSFKTDVQCRNRIDTLKKKYKREKQKQAAIGSISSKWTYYRHMDALLNSVPGWTGLPCSVDAGQIVRKNPRLSKEGKRQVEAPGNAHVASGSYGPKDDLEMSQNSRSISDEEGDERNQTSRKRKLNDAAFKSLAKAIKRFGEIYEKMENAKQQQLLDLEKTRMKFTRDLELQKMHLLMQAQMELAKMKQGSSDMDASVSNMSG